MVTRVKDTMVEVGVDGLAKDLGSYLGDRQVDDLASLRTKLASSSYGVGALVYVKDVGGPPFVVEAIGANVDDGVVVITGGSLAALRKVTGSVSAAWAGAEGGSDSSTAIDDALAVNGSAVLPAGSFTSDAKIDFQPNRVNLSGEGHATNVDINQSVDHTAFRVAALGNSDRDHTRISSMSFTSSGASAGIATAIDAQANAPLYVDNLSFFDVGKSAIKYYQCYYGGLDSVTFWDSGVDFSNVNNMKFSAFDFHADPSSTIYSPGDYMVELKDCDSIVFDVGTFETFLTGALITYECKDISFYNTWLEASYDDHVMKFVGTQSVHFYSPFIVQPTGVTKQPSDACFVVDPTRRHDGTSNSSVLTDSKRAWVVDAQAGQQLFNVTDGSSGTITSNTRNTLTATLSGGVDNDWDLDDRYTIGQPRDLITQINLDGGDITLGTSQSTAHKFCRVDNGTEGKIQAVVNIDKATFNGGFFHMDKGSKAKWSGATLSSVTSTTDLVKALETIPVAKLLDPINTHSGANNSATLTDRRQNWVVGELVGTTIYNVTDGSSGTITANTADTVTATLAGGSGNDWDKADRYNVGGSGIDPTHMQNSWVPQSQMSDPHMDNGSILTEFTSTTATLSTSRTVQYENGISTVCFIPAAETTRVHLRRTCTDLDQAQTDGDTFLFFIRMKASASVPLQMTIQGGGAAYEVCPQTETKAGEWMDYIIKPSSSQVSGGTGLNTLTYLNIFLTNDTGANVQVWFDRIDYKKVRGDVYLP